MLKNSAEETKLFESSTYFIKAFSIVVKTHMWWRAIPLRKQPLYTHTNIFQCLVISRFLFSFIRLNSLVNQNFRYLELIFWTPITLDISANQRARYIKPFLQIYLNIYYYRHKALHYSRNGKYKNSFKTNTKIIQNKYKNDEVKV